MTESDKKCQISALLDPLTRAGAPPTSAFGEIGKCRLVESRRVLLPCSKADFRCCLNCYTSNKPPSLVCVLLGHCSRRNAILNFFSSHKIAELARGLAQDVARRYPPAIANNPARMVSQQRLSGILEEVYARATEFARENKLGWYKRARLGNDFRWELNELGYDQKFVDTATEGLIFRVSSDPPLKV